MNKQIVIIVLIAFIFTQVLTYAQTNNLQVDKMQYANNPIYLNDNNGNNYNYNSNYNSNYNYNDMDTEKTNAFANNYQNLSSKSKFNNLSQIELQELRNIIISQTTEQKKLLNYAEYAVDPQIKQVFNKAAEDCENNKEKLKKFLE